MDMAYLHISPMAVLRLSGQRNFVKAQTSLVNRTRQLKFFAGKRTPSSRMVQLPKKSISKDTKGARSLLFVFGKGIRKNMEEKR